MISKDVLCAWVMFHVEAEVEDAQHPALKTRVNGFRSPCRVCVLLEDLRDRLLITVKGEEVAFKKETELTESKHDGPKFFDMDVPIALVDIEFLGAVFNWVPFFGVGAARLKEDGRSRKMRGIGMDLNGGMRIERLNRYDRENSVFKIEEGGLTPSRPVKMRTFGKEIRERLSAVCEIWDHVLEIAHMTKEGFDI